VDWETKWSGYAPVHPVVARGALLHSDGVALHATNLFGGDRLWSFRFPGDIEPDGRTNLSSLFTPVVADGTVYVALEQRRSYQPQKLQGVPITYYLPLRRLAALDLDTGEPVWQHDEAWLARHPKDREILDGLTITGAPLVRGNRVYVGGTKSLGTFQTHVVALDRRTGRVEYALRVSNGQSELNLFGRQLQESAPTPIAEADGVLYYGTNLGMFAAVDALLGTPIWLTEYPIVPLPSTYYWFEAPRRWPLFENGPPIVTDDHVVVAPADGRALLFLDRGTGRIVQSVRARGRTARGPYQFRVVHGTDGERVFASGASEVFAIRAEPDPARDLPLGAIEWRAPFDRAHIGAGRGLVTEDTLWIPTYSAIYRIGPASGKRLAPPLPRAMSPDNDAVVNLVSAHGVLVTAGREVLAARFDRDQVIADAEARVREAPNRPAVLLGAADVFLAVGQVRPAIEHYRRARQKAERAGAAAAAARAQLGLHRALLRRAYRSLEEGLRSAGADFDAAVRAAPDARTRLRARVRWDARLAAEFGGDGGRGGELRIDNLRALAKDHRAAWLDNGRRSVHAWALREIAEIHLARGEITEGLKVLHALIEAEPGGDAARAAVRRIGELIERHGRELYEPYERRAKRLFAAARKSGDLGALERGLRLYGNTRAAVPATLELARRRIEAGQPSAAARVLRRFLVEQAGRDAAPELAQARVLMIRALHDMKAHGHAYAAIQRLRGRYGDRLVTRDDGARVTARSVADEWLARAPYPAFARSAQRRDLEGPVEHRFSRKTERQRGYLDLVDVAGPLPDALNPAVFVRELTRVHVYDGRTGDQLYALECGREPKEPLVFAGDRIHATTERNSFVFDAKTGRALHARGLPDGHRAEYLVEHKGQLFLVFRDRPVRGRVGIAALHAEDGSVLWTRVLATRGGDRVHTRFQIVPRGGRLLVFSTNPLTLTVLDSTSGAIENAPGRVLDDANGLRLAPFPPVVLENGRVLLCVREQRPGRRAYSMRHTYSLFLLDLAASGPGLVLWRKRGPFEEGNRAPVKLERIGRYAVVLDQGRGAAVFETETGKLAGREETLGTDPGRRRRRFWPRLPPQPEHDSLLLMLTNAGRTERARLSAFEVPGLKQRYSVRITEERRERTQLVPSRGTLAFQVHEDRRTVLSPRLLLVDPLDGSTVQKVALPANNVEYVHARVQNGLLVVVTSDGRIHVYGPD